MGPFGSALSLDCAFLCTRICSALEDNLGVPKHPFFVLTIVDNLSFPSSLVLQLMGKWLSLSAQDGSCEALH